MSSPTAEEKKFRRNYRACLNCRVRKVKCDLGSVDNPVDGKCARCKRERKDCVFVESKKGGQQNIINGKRKKLNDSLNSYQLPPVSNILNSNESQPYPTGSSPGNQDQSLYYNSPLQSASVPHSHQTQSRFGLISDPAAQTLQQLYLHLQVYDQIKTVNEQARHRFSVDQGPSGGPIDISIGIPPSENHSTETNESPDRNLAKECDKEEQQSHHFSTMEGALVYLAKAAGTIAKADERDNIDANQKHLQLESNLKNDATKNDSENDRRSGKYTIDADDEGYSSRKNQFLTNKPGNGSIPKHILDQSNYLSIPINDEFLIRPKGSNKLSNIDYIGENGLLTEFEAEMLINLFFTTMHPYFPYIPRFLHKPKVLSGYPILLCAILTIASRYHSLDSSPNTLSSGQTDSIPRNIQVHDKLWLYVQRLISQTVWAEASTRSIGTVFAFLLITEWNPRAIHWRWSDYANRPEDSGNQDFNDNGSSKNQDSEQTLAGLGAMRRSYRMAWMLIGSAVRLAQDMGFIEVSPKTFLATHISEINSVMNISRRSMLSHSLAEVDVDGVDDDDQFRRVVNDDENVDYNLLNMNEEEIKALSSNYSLKFDDKQKAKIELLQIMSLGHESLYGYKAQLGSLSQRQNLSVLNIISPMLNSWGKKYRYLLLPSNYKQFNVNNADSFLDQNSKLAQDLNECIELEGFIFEFNYAKLYIYSLALSSTPRTENDTSKKNRRQKVNLKLDEISKSAKYIEQAFNAANEMLLVAHRIHKLKMLRFMPVRWVTRIVRAVAFIVKCYLTITAHKKATKDNQTNLNSNSFDNFDATILSLSLISVDDIMGSIQRAAITLRDCSPDELHLCTRYSNVLMYLCSEMKTSGRNFNDDPKLLNLGSSRLKESNIPASESTSSTFGGNPEISTYNSSGNNSATNLNYNGNTTSSNMSPSGNDTPLQNLVGDSEVMEWFVNNKNVGLDFVGPWTEMLEQQLNSNNQFNFDDGFM